jgi:hypothetical protein
MVTATPSRLSEWAEALHDYDQVGDMHQRRRTQSRGFVAKLVALVAEVLMKVRLFTRLVFVGTVSLAAQVVGYAARPFAQTQPVPVPCSGDQVPAFGSSYCDLHPPRSFAAGTTITIVLMNQQGGEFALRLLPHGHPPSASDGLVRDTTFKCQIFKSVGGNIRFTLPQAAGTIGQISLHGRDRAWDCQFGPGNPDAPPIVAIFAQ